jgi:hypothetical protein
MAYFDGGFLSQINFTGVNLQRADLSAAYIGDTKLINGVLSQADLRNAMFNLNPSAYLRMPFTVTDPSLFKSLTLSLRYDDGFVAYLNGSEVLRRNAPAALAWNSPATAAHGAPNAGALTEAFEGSAVNYTLTQFGMPPTPAVQPADINSTGKFLRLLYDGVNSSANSVTYRQTAPGLFQTIVADFDFRRPIVHTLFGVDRSPGITDYLLGKVPLHQAMRKIAGTNLYIMPAGEAVINPLELLNLREVKLLLDRLPTLFNWIILDSPPLLFAADASLRRLQCLGQGMCMVCVKKDWQTGFFAQAPHESGKLANTKEISLSLGRANKYGKLGFSGRRENSLQ